MIDFFDERITRRDFLKRSFGFTSALLFTQNVNSRHTRFQMIRRLNSHSNLLGRILADHAGSYEKPSRTSKLLHTYQFNDLVEISQTVLGEKNNPYNHKWFALSDGSYLPTTLAQPVESHINLIQNKINIRGELAQVTVPFTQAVPAKQNHQKKEQLFYYGSTHWVYGIISEADGRQYYRVKEDRWGDVYYVLAEHLDIFSVDELQPLHVSAPAENKRIEVSLQDQLLIAFEGEKAVFLARTSSGTSIAPPNRATPEGTYYINYKRPSRHMLHTDRVYMEDIELFGVPWVSYFTETGIAFHGTYWHNDFGVPHSHGCINLSIPAARWIYLWSQPVVPPLEHTFVSKTGTKVIVY